jgi:predicted neuraminidase
MTAILLMVVLQSSALAAEPSPLAKQPGVLAVEFLHDDMPTPQCHAATLVADGDGLVAAWFGGTREGHPDVGIWISRQEKDRWTKPVEVANGKQDGDRRWPCWNPVLYRAKDGRLLLFYKVGPNPREWWGMLVTSEDAGKTWGNPRRLPESILGPVKNKPILLADGTLLCGSSTEDRGWRVFMETTPDLGRNWKRSEPLNDGKEFGAIQPTLLVHKANRLQALCRGTKGRIVETWSDDGGKTWSALAATTLPNPNSGIDAVTLGDGRHLLVYNHTERGRSPLNVAVSEDGKTWKMALVLERERGEFSYPAVVQAPDGRVHIAYTWNRRKIRHVVVDPAKLQLSAE